MKKNTTTIILLLMVLSLIGTNDIVSAQLKPAGELKIILPNLWNEALDPMLSMAGGRAALEAVYDCLIGAKPDGSGYSKETGVATDWQLSPDGKVWTIYLRKGIQFHRGFGELTAEDVQFSLERLRSERSVATQKGYLKRTIDRIEVVDRYTIKVFSTGMAIPDFIPIMSPHYNSTEQLIVSKKAFEKLGEKGFATNPVGSGPYQFVEHIGGQYVKLEAVDKHWRVGTPRFKNVFFIAVPEEETSIAMIARGDADIAAISQFNVKRVKEKGIDVIMQKSMGGVTVWIDDQFVKGIPGNNEKVREALNLAIDRQALVDTIFEGKGRPMATFFVTSVALENMGYNWREDLYPYDPNRARKLLEEAGYPNGFDIDIYVYPYTGVREGPEVMQAIAGMWSTIGVRPKLISVDYGVVRAKLSKGEIPGAVGYFPSRAFPWQGMLGIYKQFWESSGVFTYIKSEEMDKILDRASRAIDPEITKTALKEAAKYIRKHHHAIPLLEFDVAYAVSKKVKRWDPGSLPGNLNLDSLFKSQ